MPCCYLPLIEPDGRISRIRLSDQKPHLRPQRETADSPDQFDQTKPFMELHVRVTLAVTRRFSMFPPQPPAEPSAGVLLHHLPGCRDVAETEVVGPAQQHRVEPVHFVLLVAPRR